jgi:hypothetical protein
MLHEYLLEHPTTLVQYRHLRIQCSCMNMDELTAPVNRAVAYLIFFENLSPIRTLSPILKRYNDDPNTRMQIRHLPVWHTPSNYV